jgi:hypothetical protein
METGNGTNVHSMEELGVIVKEYIRLHEEMNQQKAEIVKYRRAVAQQVDPIQKRSEVLEKSIVDYLHQNELPGIRKDGFSVFLEKKQIPVPREVKIKKVLEANPDKDPEVLTQQIVSAMKQRPPSTEFTDKLRIQKT